MWSCEHPSRKMFIVLPTSLIHMFCEMMGLRVNLDSVWDYTLSLMELNCRRKVQLDYCVIVTQNHRNVLHILITIKHKIIWPDTIALSLLHVWPRRALQSSTG